MFTLSLDLSSKNGTIALHRFEDSQKVVLVDELFISGSNDHCSMLVPTINSLLVSHHICLSQIEKFITTHGPGSFTGLRVAFATLKGISWKCKVPIEVVDGSEVRALSWIQLNLGVNAVIVLTRIAYNRYLTTYWTRNKNTFLKLESENIDSESRIVHVIKNFKSALLYDDESASILNTIHQHESFYYPLRASLIGSTLNGLKMQKSFSTEVDWLTLSPNYVGENRISIK